MKSHCVAPRSPVNTRNALIRGRFFICPTLELFYLFSRIPLSLRVSYKTELFAA
jgi:hypothetical protein